MEDKICLECQEPLRGRSDKRFCHDACRNSYNNRLNSASRSFTERINRLLQKNRRILKGILGNEKMIKVGDERLLTEGFDFTYHTHLLQTSKGNTYYFVYEYGYLALENQQYLIVKNKK